MSDKPPGLVDQFGDPISSDTWTSMRAEVAKVGGEHARPPFTGHIAFGIDLARLAGIMLAADNGNSLEWSILMEQIEETFPHLSSILGKRRRQVCQLPITVEDADGETDAERAAFKEHGETVRRWLKTKVLQTALFDMLDGIGKGFSVHEIIWGQTADHAWPLQLIYRPTRFFEFSWKDGNTIWLRSETGFDELLPHKFLVHRHPAKSGNIIRSGVHRILAFMWMYATYTQKDWTLFVQAYAMPIRVGKYGPGASDSDKRTLWRAVASIAGDVAAIIPESMQIEFVETTDRAAGAKLYEQRMDWFNREASKLILGGTAGTEALHGGHAVGQEHRQAEQDVERFDCDLLNNTINQQIVPLIVALTHGAQTAYPTLSIGRPDEIDIAKVVDAVEKLGPMGLRVKASEILDRLQLSPPEEGDEVIGGRAAAPLPPDKEPDPADPAEDPENDDPEGLTAKPFLGRLVTLSADVPAEELDALVARLARDASGALHGLTAEVRAAFNAAADMPDLARRVARLKLDQKAFAEAMSRGMALAHLVGQASLLEEITGAR